jgi:hypothetical protein
MIAAREGLIDIFPSLDRPWANSRIIWAIFPISLAISFFVAWLTSTFIFRLRRR